jgi:hypothetical protein
MVYDKATLDEEDIVAASVLVFGKSDEEMMRKVGRRWFLSPGPLGSAGVMLLDDNDGNIFVTRYSADLKPLSREHLSTSTGAKLRVSGS